MHATICNIFRNSLWIVTTEFVGRQYVSQDGWANEGDKCDRLWQVQNVVKIVFMIFEFGKRFFIEFVIQMPFCNGNPIKFGKRFKIKEFSKITGFT